jgi:hypothetical protein
MRPYWPSITEKRRIQPEKFFFYGRCESSVQGTTLILIHRKLGHELLLGPYNFVPVFLEYGKDATIG